MVNPIKEKPFTEIAGTWPEVKSYFLGMPETRSDKIVMEAVIREIIQAHKYQDNSLLTVEELFNIVELVCEKAKQMNLPAYADIVNTNLSKDFRLALKSGDLANNTDLSSRDLIAEIILDDVFDKVPSGLTMIIFDICCNEWFKANPKDTEKSIELTADQILEARGLLKKPGEGGRRGGYRREQREEVERQLKLLHSIMINVERGGSYTNKGGKRARGTYSLKSPAIVLEYVEKWIPDSQLTVVDNNGLYKEWPEDHYSFVLRPGKVFATYMIGEEQQYAQLNEKAWQYDHARQSWEISLAYYFSRLWRIRAYKKNQLHQGITVRTILHEIGQSVDNRNPGRSRARLEKALDRLKEDKIISSWKYNSLKYVKTRGWVEKWLDCKVEVMAPKELIEKYTKQVRDKKEDPFLPSRDMEMYWFIDGRAEGAQDDPDDA